MGTIATVLVYATFAELALVSLGTVAMDFTLRRRFPELWTKLGEPTEWFALVRTSRDQHVLEFLEHRDYRRTADAAFIRLCEVLRVGWYVFFGLFVVALVCLGVSLLAQA